MWTVVSFKEKRQTAKIILIKTYLFFAFIWASGFRIRKSGLFFYSAQKTMIWMGVERNRALGKFFNPNSMISLGREHILQMIKKKKSNLKLKKEGPRKPLILFSKTTHRNHSKLYFICNMKLVPIQNFTEVEEHTSITIHTLDETKTISHGSNYTLKPK